MDSLIELDIPSAQKWLEAQALNPVHARRLLRHFYEHAFHPDWSQIVLPKSLPAILDQYTQPQTKIRHRHVSADGTVKLLIELQDGQSIESVLMPGHRPTRSAACVSSQVGCAMACDFCASTRHGLQRNLSIVEIVEQYLHLRNEAQTLGRDLNTLVFMGMGEPMHNLPNVIEAIKRIADPDLGALGWRQVTVSTVGIVPGIETLAQADLNVHLALSLHAADDETRNKIVPANRKYSVAQILQAAKDFHARTKRIVTLEWCLLNEVNDTMDQADKLIDLLRDFRVHVNVIPWNSIGTGISGAIYQKPSPERVVAFLERLRFNGVVAHLRETRGDDVSAACGQLITLPV